MDEVPHFWPSETCTCGRSDKWVVPGAAPIRVPGAHPTPTSTLPTAPPPSRRSTTPGSTSLCSPNNSLSDLWDVGLVRLFFRIRTYETFQKTSDLWDFQNLTKLKWIFSLVGLMRRRTYEGEPSKVWPLSAVLRSSSFMYFADILCSLWEKIIQ